MLFCSLTSNQGDEALIPNNKQKEFAEFTSKVKWKHPDTNAYQKQKRVQMIQQEFVWPWSYQIASRIPNQPNLLGNEQMGHLWSSYYCPRIEASSQGNDPCYPSFFPGHTVPGAGAGNNVRWVGTLALQRFYSLLALDGSMPKIGSEKGEKLAHGFSKMEQIDNWPWKYITQPRLEVISPAQGEKSDGPMIESLMQWIKKELSQRLASGEIREALTFIRRCWSPYTKDPVWAPETIGAAKQLFELYSNAKNLLSVSWEIEAVLSHVQYSWPLNVSGYGIYQGSWVEVGRLPIGDIRCTELAVTERVLHELVNVRTKGFAPIVVNEWGCDTDGTHRIVSAWMWNLLSPLRGDHISPNSEDIQKRVGAFIHEYRKLMGEVVVREVLRILEEILQDERMNEILVGEVLPYLGHYYPITHLPVLLLSEYSCGAVIKGPYDDGVGCYQVDPRIYELMAKNSSLTLPARGPYHLTDRGPLPWFEVLERR